MPEILQAAADEYDRLKKEMYELKEDLIEIRKELSHSLY